MKLKNYPLEKLSEQILLIIGKYLSLKDYRVFYFGSRVNGGKSERSDIDLGIEGPKKVPSVTMMKIKDEIDNLPILYTIDVVDFKDVSEDFYEVAKAKIEYLNS